MWRQASLTAVEGGFQPPGKTLELGAASATTEFYFYRDPLPPGWKPGVMRDIPDKQAKRQIIAMSQLPELIKRMRELEKQVAALSARNPVS